MMVIKVYVSDICASKEVKKHQQRAIFTLDSLKVAYETVNVTEPGHEAEKEMLKEVCKKRAIDQTSAPVFPQFFNDDVYCGDWEDFYLASDDDKVTVFLKLEEDKPEVVEEVIEASKEGEVNAVNGQELNGDHEMEGEPGPGPETLEVAERQEEVQAEVEETEEEEVVAEEREEKAKGADGEKEGEDEEEEEEESEE